MYGLVHALLGRLRARLFSRATLTIEAELRTSEATHSGALLSLPANLKAGRPEVPVRLAKSVEARSPAEPGMTLLIDRQGQIRCVYGEAIDLAALGRVSIRRASDVEPDATGRWWSDLALVNGPQLGPFARRSQALAAERAWLEANLAQVQVLATVSAAPSLPGVPP